MNFKIDNKNQALEILKSYVSEASEFLINSKRQKGELPVNEVFSFFSPISWHDFTEGLSGGAGVRFDNVIKDLEEKSEEFLLSEDRSKVMYGPVEDGMLVALNGVRDLITYRLTYPEKNKSLLSTNDVNNFARNKAILKNDHEIYGFFGMLHNLNDLIKILSERDQKIASGQKIEIPDSKLKDIIEIFERNPSKGVKGGATYRVIVESGLIGGTNITDSRPKMGPN